MPNCKPSIMKKYHKKYFVANLQRRMKPMPQKTFN